MTLDINWLAVLVAAVVTFVLGGVWYGPLFGKVWRTAEGQAEPQPGRQKHPALVYGLSPRSFVVGLVVGVGWVATSFGVNYLFAGRRLALFAVDAGYNVVLFALMGLIIGLFG